MSERDDALIDLLRADLAEAVQNRPPAGFEVRVRDAVDQQRGAGSRTLQRLAGPALALGTAVVLAVVVGAGVLLRHTGTSAPARPGPPIHPVPVLSTPTVVAHGNPLGIYALLDASRGDAAHQQQQFTVRFVRGDGRLLSTVSLDPAVRMATVGGDRVFYVSGAELISVGVDGRQRNEGSLTGMGTNAPSVIERSFAVSPDGTRWVWSTDVASATSGIQGEVRMAGRDQATHTILRQTFPPSRPMTLTVVAWKDAGIVVVEQPNGVGGGPSFFANTYWRTARVIDPDTLAQRAVSGSPDCTPFEDVAVDGSSTCLLQVDRSTIVLTRGDGTKTRLHIPGTVAQAGYALISADGRRVAVGVASQFAGTAQPFPRGSEITEVVDVATGVWSKAGASGKVPVGWLVDGTLVLEDEISPGEFGGRPNSAGLLRPDGSFVDLGPGAYLGALDPAHAAATYLHTAQAPYGTATP